MGKKQQIPKQLDLFFQTNKIICAINELTYPASSLYILNSKFFLAKIISHTCSIHYTQSLNLLSLAFLNCTHNAFCTFLVVEQKLVHVN